MKSRSATALAAATACAIAMLGLVATPSGAATAGRTQFSGDAFGTQATVGSVVKLGKTALVGLGPCGTMTPPVHAANTVATVTAPPYAASGQIDSTADAVDSGGVQTATLSASSNQASVLSGLITSDEVTASAAASFDGSSASTSAAGSQLVNLVVAGQAISGTPPPNTRIDLAGVGYVILNEQSSRVSATSASLIVNMIHVHVTIQNPLVPVGTQVIVSHAQASVVAGKAGTLDGQAYGTRAQVQGTALSGKTAPVSLGCLGTGGQVRSNQVAAVTLPPEFSVGTVTDTATGTVTSTLASSETSSTVQTVDLVSGLVTADVVTADAHASTDGSVFTFSDQGTQFANLSVSGHPEITSQVAPNTQVAIAGLGTLWLRREIQTAHSLEVRMIELVVSQDNQYGIPVGADVRIAVAEASAH
jgi:hypothetical protein